MASNSIANLFKEKIEINFSIKSKLKSNIAALLRGEKLFGIQALTYSKPLPSIQISGEEGKAPCNFGILSLKETVCNNP
jgi:hypothetical protein